MRKFVKPKPLTLALSRRERGLKARAGLRNATHQPPLPLGEGWGEGRKLTPMVQACFTAKTTDS